MLFDLAKWALVLEALARLSFAYNLRSKSVLGQDPNVLAKERWLPANNTFWSVLTDVKPETNTWFFTGSNPQFITSPNSADMYFSHDAFVTRLTDAAMARGESFPSSSRVQIITIGPWNGHDAEAAHQSLKGKLLVASTQNYQYLPHIDHDMYKTDSIKDGAETALTLATKVRSMMLGNNATNDSLIIYVHCLRGGDRTGVVKAAYEMMYGGFTGVGATHDNGPRNANEVWQQSTGEVPDGRGMQEYWAFSFQEICRSIGRTPADCVLNATCGYEPDNEYGPFCI